MKRLLFIIVGLVAVTFFAQAVLAASPSTRKENEWTAEQKFTKGIQVGTTNKARIVIDDGEISVYDSSNNRIFYLDNSGVNYFPQQFNKQALVYTAGIGFELPVSDEAGFYTVDVTAVANSNLSATGSSGALAAATAGVTIVLPVPTAAMAGRIYPIHKIDSGTTLIPLICMPSGATMSSQALPINSATGVTNVEMDALGDILWLMPDYNSAVSWWIVNRYIH